ncbi:hypothetical protein CG736_00095 [Kitasatospora sp. CB02891]|nr:hypothetical protein CG736_00095 [Kitasatospora sp. CB02891]
MRLPKLCGPGVRRHGVKALRLGIVGGQALERFFVVSESRGLVRHGWGAAVGARLAEPFEAVRVLLVRRNWLGGERT